MDCYRQGELIVVMKEGGGKEFGELLTESEKTDVILAYSIQDIIRYYDERREEFPFLGQLGQKDESFSTLPFLVNVPIGKEIFYAEEFQRMPQVMIAVPNFLTVTLQPDVQFNQKEMNFFLTFLNAEPPGSLCGSEVKVAVLDTGIDQNLFSNRMVTQLSGKEGGLYYRQFDVDQPRNSSTRFAPYDSVGHGSVVGSIINRIAPGSIIFSIKVMDRSGDLMALLAGMYLAQMRLQPHIYNLSLGVECDIDQCVKCKNIKRSPFLSWQAGQLFSLFFEQAKSAGHMPLVIAAAGNHSKKIMFPASLPGIVAVGSIDLRGQQLATYCKYDSIPQSKFFLAPGGENTVQMCVATKNGFGQPEPLYGTSFSTAFVTGIASRYRCGRCGALIKSSDDIFQCLISAADTTFSGYSPKIHGLGIVKYDLEFRADSIAASQQENNLQPLEPITSLEDLKDKVSKRAYIIWRSKGSIEGSALDNWLEAKQVLGIPDQLDI